MSYLFLNAVLPCFDQTSSSKSTDLLQFLRLHVVDVDDWMSNEQSKLEIGRMPWHDVHVSISGPAVLDVAHHFIERWNFVKEACSLPPSVLQDISASLDMFLLRDSSNTREIRTSTGSRL